MDVTKIFDDRTPKAVRKAENLESRRQDSHHGDVQPRLSALQQSIGNRAVQRLLAQRSSDEPSDLDEGTADRINRGRSEGQLLNTQTQMQMGASLGHDFGNVHVHTSRESDQLNRQLGARAFTTGQDVFFRDGAYQPHTSDGQELIAHELTHVIQQASGMVGNGGGPMTVNAPGDKFEKEADAAAKSVRMSEAGMDVQRLEDDEEEIQTQVAQQALDEDEDLQSQLPEDEMPVQMQELDDEEESLS